MMSWEILEQKKVLCGILHCDIVSMPWSLGLRNLIIPGQIIPVAGMPFDMARNVVCQQALQGGFQYVGFLDSDVVPPRDAFLRLLARNKPFISGVYCRRSPPHGLPVMIKNGQWVTRLPEPHENPLIEVDLVGAGLLLIHRTVLEKLPPSDEARGKHWFDWRVDMAGKVPPGEALSEDFALCANLKRHLGISPVVDTSIRARHVGLAQADYGSLLPAESNPHT